MPPPRTSDLAWLETLRPAGATLRPRSDLAMLAVQGRARAKNSGPRCPNCARQARRSEAFLRREVGETFIARTGYTGEDGFELLLPAGRAADAWQRLRRRGRAPLRARRTRYAAAGGRHEPLRTGHGCVGHAVRMRPRLDGRAGRQRRDFVGRPALERRAPAHRLLGLVLEERGGVLRAHQAVRNAHGEGIDHERQLLADDERLDRARPRFPRPAARRARTGRGPRPAGSPRARCSRRSCAAEKSWFEQEIRDEHPREPALHRQPRMGAREADGTLAVGITDHAQDSLGELVFVEMPEAGRQLAAGDACAVVESVKAASDVYAPVAGEVIARNDALGGGAGTRSTRIPMRRGCSGSSPPRRAAWTNLMDAGGLPQELRRRPERRARMTLDDLLDARRVRRAPHRARRARRARDARCARAAVAARR